MYTNEIICNDVVLKLTEYADDMALTACLHSLSHPLTGPFVGVRAWRLPMSPDPSTLECCLCIFVWSTSFSAAFERIL